MFNRDTVEKKMFSSETARDWATAAYQQTLQYGYMTVSSDKLRQFSNYNVLSVVAQQKGFAGKDEHGRICWTGPEPTILTGESLARAVTHYYAQQNAMKRLKTLKKSNGKSRAPGKIPLRTQLRDLQEEVLALKNAPTAEAAIPSELHDTVEQLSAEIDSIKEMIGEIMREIG